MTRCETARAGLDDDVDGELESARRAQLLEHLHECEHCATELEDRRRVVDALQRVFAEDQASAPTAPHAIIDADRTEAGGSTTRSVDAERRGGSRWFRGIAALAAAGILALTVSFLPEGRVEASPLELVRSASEHYMARRDFELRVTPRSQALNVLEALFGEGSVKSGGESIEKALEPWRVLVGHPNRIVAMPTKRDGDGSTWATGFDGSRAWTYEPKENTVRLGELDALELEFSDSTRTSIAVDDLTQIFSGRFLQKMFEDSNDLELVEITGPYDRRVGHRTFRCRITKDDEEVDWVRAELTIDPRNQILERFVVDLNYGGFSFFELEVEMVAVDQGLDGADFDFRGYVPENARVVMRSDDDTDSDGRDSEANEEGSDPDRK